MLFKFIKIIRLIYEITSLVTEIMIQENKSQFPILIDFIVIIIKFQKMRQVADPNLLSLLEKISNPLSKVDISINLKGVYAPP